LLENINRRERYIAKARILAMRAHGGGVSTFVWDGELEAFLDMFWGLVRGLLRMSFWMEVVNNEPRSLGHDGSSVILVVDIIKYK
jgi:hypothetical protein